MTGSTATPPRLGILTSGGDCPGLNAVIRSAHIRITRAHGGSLVGFRNGWKGLIEDDAVEVDEALTDGIAGAGGTVLGTSRTDPLATDDGLDRVRHAMRSRRLDGLIAIGGEGSLSAANVLSDLGVPIVGVPKTIDNDLLGTDYTFGFDTAVQIATDAMDRLLTTGASHGRCMVAEVMGRNTGWIALHAGIAVGAHGILIPDQPADMSTVAGWIASAVDRGQAPLIVVAEGYRLPDDTTPYSVRGFEADGRPRFGGIGERMAPLIEQLTGIETRATTLGHIQRGGTPTAFDRVLASRFGAAAVDAAVAGEWSRMVSLQGERISVVPLEEALRGLKSISRARYDRAAVCFG